MKKPFVILIILIFTVITLVGVRSIVANEISTSGVALGKTQNETKKFKIENAMLKEEILNIMDNYGKYKNQFTPNTK